MSSELVNIIDKILDHEKEIRDRLEHINDGKKIVELLKINENVTKDE